MGGRLPDHLILDQILPRLPVKSVTRFKTVCKTWYSAISTPEFIQSHLACSSSHPQLLVHGHGSKFKLSGNSTYIYLLPYGECGKTLGNLVKLDCNIMGSDTEIVGVGNGLVCLTFFYSREEFFFLWNPATSELCKIEYPCRAIFQAWFNYVSSIDDYKIVAYLMDVRPENGCSCYFYVYSFKVAEWKRIAVVDWDGDGSTILCSSKPTLVNDTLYWGDHLFEWDDVEGQDKWIAFNLATEQLKEFPRMNWLNIYKLGHTFTIRGRLSLLCWVNHFSDVGDVWMLKQQDNWNSWEKSFTVNFGPEYWFRNIFETGKCVVGYKQLKVYDLFEEAEEQCQEVTKLPGNPKNVMPYFETLVSPSRIANGRRQTT